MMIIMCLIFLTVGLLGGFFAGWLFASMRALADFAKFSNKLTGEKLELLGKIAEHDRNHPNCRIG